jgi:hypothetical protein
MDRYKYEYLITRKQYLDSRNGYTNNNLSIIEGGGSADYFKSTTRLYIMGIINNPTVYNKLNNISSELLLGERPRNRLLHITLLQMHINDYHPYSYIFFDPKFHKRIRTYFDDVLADKNLQLRSTDNIKEGYKLLGSGDNQFLSRLYYPNIKYAVTEFRTLIYKDIQRQLGKSELDVIDHHNIRFYVLSYPDKYDKPLLSIPEYYYGKGEWVPHISILSIKDIKNNNYNLYNLVSSKKTDKSKIKILLNFIDKKILDIKDHISFKNNINKLLISMRNPKRELDLEYFI